MSAAGRRGLQVVSAPKRFGDHHNAFGFLRLALASLVIVSHTPEIVDGDRRREVLTRLFGTISFGEFAVDGFFVVSGFLITASFLTGAGPVAYLTKRIARIYPAFVLSSLLCVFVLGPAVGGRFEHGALRGTAGALGRALLLCPPVMAHVFQGTFYPALNGAAWTIQYEFDCYLLVLALGVLGLLRSARVTGVAAVACLLLHGFAPPAAHVAFDHLPLGGLILTGDRLDLLRLAGLFLAGATFYLIQGRVSLSPGGMAVAAVLLCTTLFVAPLAHLGFAVFGAYLLFAVAALGSGTILARINNRDDISYGLYLYAWPIEKLLLWWRAPGGLVVVGVLTWVLAVAAGALSWFLLEKPVMRRVRNHARAA